MAGESAWIKANYHKFTSEEKLKDAGVLDLKTSRTNITKAFLNLKVTNWWKTKTPIKSQDVVPAKAGREAFKEMFSKTAIEIRRTGKLHKTMESAIDTILKKREWIPDKEFQTLLKFNSVEWSILKRDFDYLQITDLLDENRRKATVWAHPDSIEALRKLANE
jgi:hypothetical protein